LSPKLDPGLFVGVGKRGLSGAFWQFSKIVWHIL
jgi:hypothetical protein